MSMIEDEIAALTRKCISCGKCTQHCPSYEYGGIDPHEIMVGGESDLSACIACATCSRVCNYTDPFSVIRDMKALESGAHVPEVYRETGYVTKRRDHPSRDELETVWDGDQVQIIPGCGVECMAPFLEHAASVAIRSVGKTCEKLEGAGCCLRPVVFREMSAFERNDTLKKMVARAGDSEVVTLCGGCTEAFEGVNEDAPHILQFLHRNMELIPKLKRPIKVALEPGCACMHMKKELKELAEHIGCETVGNDMGCCGRDTHLSPRMMEDREAECGNASLIVACCPKCFMKYDAQPGGMPVMYVAELVALAFGNTDTLKYHAIPIDLDSDDFYKPRVEGFIPKKSKGARW